MGRAIHGLNEIVCGIVQPAARLSSSPGGDLQFSIAKPATGHTLAVFAFSRPADVAVRLAFDESKLLDQFILAFCH